MSAVEDILGQIPMSQLAGQLGVDEQTAQDAARQALPALLGGLDANAQDPAGARSLREALGQHDPALVDGGVDLAQVDAAEGDKIVGHIFGGNRDAVVSRLGGATGQGEGLVGRLLPILAPIVLSYLTKRMSGQATTAGGAAPGGAGAGGGLGDLLGGILGGAGGQGSPTSAGSITDLLGGLLGGGRR